MGLNDHLRPLWKAAGYDRGNGSAGVVPPPGPGFKRLYYLTGPDHAVSNIVFRRVKVSRFSELNDPFELLGTNFADKGVRKVVRAHKSDLDDKFGLICFSEDWVDPVLWSHYAAKHSGIALGFDIGDTLVKRVIYQPQRLTNRLKKGTTTISSQTAEALITTKFESWAYEKEWRLLVALEKANQEGKLYFKNMGKDLRLAEVILGPACNFSLQAIRKIVGEHHSGVTTFQARLAYRSFRVIAKGNSVPAITT